MLKKLERFTAGRFSHQNCYFSFIIEKKVPNCLVNTHYYNSNLIWRTVSRRVDEVIPLDNLRHKALRVIPWDHLREVILYARSKYFYNNMFIIYLFLTNFDFINCFGL